MWLQVLKRETAGAGFMSVIAACETSLCVSVVMAKSGGRHTKKLNNGFGGCRKE